MRKRENYNTDMSKKQDLRNKIRVVFASGFAFARALANRKSSSIIKLTPDRGTKCDTLVFFEFQNLFIIHFELIRILLYHVEMSVL